LFLLAGSTYFSFLHSTATTLLFLILATVPALHVNWKRGNLNKTAYAVCLGFFAGILASNGPTLYEYACDGAFVLYFAIMGGLIVLVSTVATFLLCWEGKRYSEKKRKSESAKLP
jgi:hypothetical protein